MNSNDWQPVLTICNYYCIEMWYVKPKDTKCV